MKKAYIEGTFPQLIAHRNTVVGRGQGGNLALAIYRAAKDMFKKPELRGKKHLDGFVLRVSVTDVKPEKEEANAESLHVG